RRSSDLVEMNDPEELSKMKLKLDVDGINYKIHKDKKSQQISVQLLPEFPLCLTKTGDVNIKLDITKGIYPNDKSSHSLTYEIIDVTFWEKCKNVIINGLIILFIIWYVFGLIKRNKFCKRQSLVMQPQNSYDDTYRRRERSYLLKKRVTLLQKLIPYRSDRVKIDGTLYIASESCDSVYVKNSPGSGYKVDYEDIGENNQKHVKLYSGSTFENGTNIYILK
ncbi:MAG: hypothetical protein KDC52_17930, partial [Ignavibacteriae bacterium]|nr:hypothetical protein [Ignavibacteriota bacterium]